MSVVDVGAVEEFPSRVMRIVQAEGVELGVCRWDGEFFAMRNSCPHQGAPVCRGFLQARLTGRCSTEGVEMETTAEEPVILCAWHRWEFSLRTGESAWDSGYKVKTYPVSVADGRVMVRVRSTEGD